MLYYGFAEDSEKLKKNMRKTFKLWRCRNFLTKLFYSQKFNKYGRLIFVVAVKGQQICDHYSEK